MSDEPLVQLRAVTQRTRKVEGVDDIAIEPGGAQPPDDEDGDKDGISKAPEAKVVVVKDRDRARNGANRFLGARG